MNNGGMLENKVKSLFEEATGAITKATDSKTLYDVKVHYLGKQGLFSNLMKEMGSLPKEERPQFGQLVNVYKQKLEEAFEQAAGSFKAKELNERLSKEKLDMSFPGPDDNLGTLHPVTLVMNRSVQILSRIGYSVRTGPLIESDWYNFEALNIPKDHPARALQDTFYVTDDTVLRTHTSPIQIRTMEAEKPPLRVVAPGPVCRADSDISHSPNFHQIEGLLVDRKVSMADLKGTISYFIKELFGSSMKIRFRPSFFPFTEPSAEFNCSCPICKAKGCRMCKQSGWIEIGGCGLVNPKVLEYAKLDPNEWQGFAFGFGLERMAIILYGIEDIKLFSENDLRFLRQFQA